MFKLTIRTDNAAFGEAGAAEECARILRHIATKMENGHEDGRVMDHNGNHVGEWELEVEETEKEG